MRLTDEQQYDLLRAWRTQVALRLNVLRYIVLSDAAIREIVRLRPRLIRDLYVLPPVVLSRYKIATDGPNILNVTYPR